MFRLVYEQASLSSVLDDLYVATDDKRIYEAVAGFGGRVLMTSPDHPSGTDRCQEAVEQLMNQQVVPDVIINVQGDEPGIHPGLIDLVGGCFSDPAVDIATLAKTIETSDELFSATVNKVILDQYGNALYFSRSQLPHIRNAQQENWL